MQWTISPDLTNMNTVLRNDTLTIDVTGLPRHTFARLSLSVDAWTEGNVADGVTFTVRAGTHSATMVRQNDWPGPGAHWTLADTVLDDWFEHVGSSMSITITASGFPAERGGGTGGSGTTLPPEPGSYWTLHNFSLSTGIPTVSVIPLSDGSEEPAAPFADGDTPQRARFLLHRSEPRIAALRVALDWAEGTALQSIDFEGPSSHALFELASDFVIVGVKPIWDCEEEGRETIFCAISPHPSYLVDAALGIGVAEIDDPFIPRMRQRLIEEEGRRTRVYLDERGNLTIGIGHNLGPPGSPVGREAFERLTGANFDQVASGQVELTDDQVEALFRDDLQRAVDQVRRDCPNFEHLPLNVKEALTDMVFNMGSLVKFKDLREAISRKDYRQAAWDIGHKTRAPDSPASDYAQQLPGRSMRNIRLVEQAAAEAGQ